MSPEQTATAALLARLRQELAVDREALRRMESKLRSLQTSPPQPLDEAHLAFGAVCIHGWYTGLETLIERVLTAIDQSTPSGARSHAELLSQAAIELPGMRPALFPHALVGTLSKVLSFRHFFRHAYAVEWDPEEIRKNIERVLMLEPSIRTALDAFDGFLQEAHAQALQQ